ncbi:MAG: S58 family peptidase, partial [Bacteroidia bacterium]|nr:S58 family peptidase [Bacteroidia bacterium]
MKNLLAVALLSFSIMNSQPVKAQERVRDFGIEIGLSKPGKYNAITDV